MRTFEQWVRDSKGIEADELHNRNDMEMAYYAGALAKGETLEEEPHWQFNEPLRYSGYYYVTIETDTGQRIVDKIGYTTKWLTSRKVIAWMPKRLPPKPYIICKQTISYKCNIHEDKS